MSYDLRLFQIPDGLDIEAAYERLVQREEAETGNIDEWVRRQLPEAARVQMQQLADAIRAQWAPLIQFEPKSPLPWIELNDENLQLQVSVYADSVSITMPYFRERTPEVMDCIHCCIQVCQEHRGYAAFDPQLGRAVTTRDRESMTRAYHDIDDALPGIRGNSPPKRRWWQFWSRRLPTAGTLSIILNRRRARSRTLDEGAK